ncbi:MAG: hypothetical protein COT17_03925 [Elusimicrobia bacterium CG08_land_8_20_14_0_20_51_18]|nr:MAG: hypothetical protein COT17_03925 [Elusimicrobia bacterium CG08_land_8_20_14_0_20_51_18]
MTPPPAYRLSGDLFKKDRPAVGGQAGGGVRKAVLPVLAFFIVFYFYAGISFVKKSAATYDETVHLSSGYSYLETGKYRMNIMDHPPLAEMLAAAPLKFLKLNSFVTHRYFQSRMPYNYGDLFLYQNNADAEKILNTSRYFLLLFWSPLFLVLFYLFGRFSGGKNAGFAAVLLFSVNPVFISNIPLVTTDIAPAFFYFSACLAGFLLSSGEKTGFRLLENRYALAAAGGAAAGLAMASKYSMFVLPPLFSALLIFDNFFSNKFKIKELVKIISVFLAVSLLALLVVYKGDMTLYSDALTETFRRLSGGRSSFIMGKHSVEGVWWYFPAAFALKSPLFLTALFLAGLFFMFREYRKFLWILAPFFFYFLSAMSSKVQIGVRHILPALPFVLLIAAYGIVKIYDKFRRKSLYLLAPFFLFSFFSVAKTHPFYLSYFSEAAGGAEKGWEYLTDSNIDWGQDLKSLSGYLREKGNPPVVLAYFGVANPAYYGLNYVPLGLVSNVPFEPSPADLCSSEKILLAVSVTNLQGTYYADKDTFSWLRTREPVYRAGYSIFLYDLTEDREGAETLDKLFKKSGLGGYAACADKRRKAAAR